MRVGRSLEVDSGLGLGLGLGFLRKGKNHCGQAVRLWLVITLARVFVTEFDRMHRIGDQVCVWLTK